MVVKVVANGSTVHYAGCLVVVVVVMVVQYIDYAGCDRVFKLHMQYNIIASYNDHV